MRKLMIMSAALLLLTNLVVLSGVAYNRAGEPQASLELTERELTQPAYFASVTENSATSLQLEWQLVDSSDDPDFTYTRYVVPAWLNNAKLTELGFDVESLINKKDAVYEMDLSARDVVLVLEYEGAAYQQALVLAERKVAQLRDAVKKDPGADEPGSDLAQYESQLNQLKISGSRLYVIDAGLDMQALQQKYADKNKHLFARGEIGLDWSEKGIYGRIRHLYIPDIHVPLPYSQQLTAITKGESHFSSDREPMPPRYQVRLNIGKRLEPWIESVRPYVAAHN